MNRKALLDALRPAPRSLSELAAELGASRKDVVDALPHIVRSVRAAGRRLIIVPARCRACDFAFDADKLSKPSRCPSCRGTWVYEPLIGIET
jgi:transcriptional regulator